MDATLTNSVTNALHSTFLCAYFLFALKYWLKKDNRFTGLMVTFFFTLFILKILGIWVHSAMGAEYSKQIWLAICLILVFFNYSIFHAMNIPTVIRAMVIGISIMSVWFNTIFDNFLFIAAASLITYLFAIIYSKGLTRIGFIGIVVSNIIWIIFRESANAYLGHELPLQWRYDNDIYHILLLISTFTLYKSIIKGDWPYLKNGI